MNMKKVMRAINYIPSIVIFVLTMYLMYLCISGGFAGLIYAKYYGTAVFFWFIFSIFFVMWLVSFAVLLFDDPGSMKNEVLLNKNHNCQYYCPKCGQVKPYRAHHCATCEACFACMDHHCSVFGRCIALRNRKVFIQYLFDSIVMLTIYTIVSALSMVINTFDGYPYFLLLQCFVGISLAVLLALFLYQQMKVMFHGHTLVEEIYEIPYVDGLTKYERFKEVFGPPSLDWLVPRPLRNEYGNAFQWERFRNAETKKEE